MAVGVSEATQTKVEFNAARYEVCETFGLQKFHEEQQKAIALFFDGKTVRVSLPTGYGKAIKFQAMPASDRIASLEETVYYFHRVTSDSAHGRSGPTFE